MAAEEVYRARTRTLGGMAHRYAPNDRLTAPLVREAGELRPATWDEALARAADGFRTDA